MRTRWREVNYAAFRRMCTEDTPTVPVPAPAPPLPTHGTPSQAKAGGVGRKQKTAVPLNCTFASCTSAH